MQESNYVIVVGVDFSEPSEHALGVARKMAEQNGRAVLHVVHVVAPPIGSVAITGAAPNLATEFTETLDRARDELATLCRGLETKLEGRVFGHVRMGTPAREITSLADSLSADLIVVGTHGRTGLGRVLLGSIAETVLRHAPCSVLTTRKPREQPFIEDPCPGCLAARKRGDASARCMQHTRTKLHVHTYHEGPDGFAHQSFRFGGS
jgi:nucleotide-binding universal stress UspA family protein